MKELTIEEKAKFYEEAIERARIYHSTTDSVADSELIELIFPELKEVDDEEIRKEIMDFIYDKTDSYELREKSNSWLAWLEKQGESIKIEKGKNYLCTKTHKYAGVEWIEGVKYYSPEDYSLVNEGCTCYCPKYSKEEHNNFFKEVEYDDCLEADKVEPKFKEGDWVVYDSWTTKILKVTHDGYVNNKQGFIPKEREESMRLWDIAKDAKDGDVLAVESENDYPSPFIAIYKERGLDFFNSHCFISFDGKFNEGTTGHSIYHVHPATKEQRDTLMKAMADAGYTFDFEKKELKKIEQNPAKEYSFNIESELFQQLTKEQQGLWRKEIEQAYNVGANTLKPSEWSKEGDKLLVIKKDEL